MALDVKEWIRGKCFICGQLCASEGYCHYECAVSYTEESDKRKRIELLKKEEKYK